MIVSCIRNDGNFLLSREFQTGENKSTVIKVKSIMKYATKNRALYYDLVPE